MHYKTSSFLRLLFPNDKTMKNRTKSGLEEKKPISGKWFDHRGLFQYLDLKLHIFFANK